MVLLFYFILIRNFYKHTHISMFCCDDATPIGHDDPTQNGVKFRGSPAILGLYNVQISFDTGVTFKF